LTERILEAEKRHEEAILAKNDEISGLKVTYRRSYNFNFGFDFLLLTNAINEATVVSKAFSSTCGQVKNIKQIY
jgi:hypothetical protein